jgi:SAM-dependent methyltransferase
VWLQEKNSNQILTIKASSIQGTEFLSFNSKLIRSTANNRLEETNLIKLFLRQVWSEERLKFIKKINFRKKENIKAREAYCGMNIQEFEEINARQQWANWRTIPKSLTGRLPNKPLFALDLCCGTGHSTEVLACYLPLGSRIIGIEYNPNFVKRASGKSYFHLSGKECSVGFSSQSVLEQLKDDKGNVILDESVDIINSSGAVGSHFDKRATAILAMEIRRVLKKNGIALIDSGLPGTKKNDLINIFISQGFKVFRTSKSCFFDLFTQVCFEKI